MKKTILVLALCATASAGIGAAVAQARLSLAGNWSQSSSGKELVLVSKIKLQPNVGVGMGTSLGGSVGYGSMTRTAIVTEPTPLNVTRSMKLRIAADGSFTWSISKRHAEGANCTRTTQQEKRGRVTQSGSKMVFAIDGGTESFSKSCGGKGSTALPASTERYDVTSSGNKMSLSSGPNRWTFVRG